MVDLGALAFDEVKSDFSSSTSPSSLRGERERERWSNGVMERAIGRVLTHNTTESTSILMKLNLPWQSEQDLKDQVTLSVTPSLRCH
jgi:hypothetical protein